MTCSLVVQSQMGDLNATQARTRTPARAALPLTAALGDLSYSLSKSDLSADGEEAGPVPGVPEMSYMDPAEPARTVYSLPPPPTAVPPKDGSSVIAQDPGVACGERPCFSGVPCELSVGGAFRCGRCPAGYLGDGRTCRGGTRGLLGRPKMTVKLTVGQFVASQLASELAAQLALARST